MDFTLANYQLQWLQSMPTQRFVSKNRVTHKCIRLLHPDIICCLCEILCVTHLH